VRRLEEDLTATNAKFESETGYVLDPDVQKLLITLYVGGRSFDGWVFTLHQINEMCMSELGLYIGQQYTEYLEYILDADHQKFASPSTTPHNESSLLAKRQYSMRQKVRHLKGAEQTLWVNKADDEVDFLSTLIEKKLITIADLREFLAQAMQLIGSFAEQTHIPVATQEDGEEEPDVFFLEKIEEETPQSAGVDLVQLVG
jgi:hypothetical protein